jgi:tRNA (mo5U34)-methyltransferase
VEESAAAGETFDLVLFLGVFYHLRHPLQVLESIRKVCRERLLLQTITTPHRKSSYHTCPPPAHRDSGLRARDLNAPDFPLVRFVEGKLDGDVSCWFVPSPEAVLAMLRSCGFHPETMIFPTKHETLVSARAV